MSNHTDYCNRCHRHLTHAEEAERWCDECRQPPLKSDRPQVDRGVARDDEAEAD
jgi:hypothetical protein